MMKHHDYFWQSNYLLASALKEIMIQEMFFFSFVGSISTSLLSLVY